MYDENEAKVDIVIFAKEEVTNNFTTRARELGFSITIQGHSTFDELSILDVLSEQRPKTVIYMCPEDQQDIFAAAQSHFEEVTKAAARFGALGMVYQDYFGRVFRISGSNVGCRKHGLKEPEYVNVFVWDNPEKSKPDDELLIHLLYGLNDYEAITALQLKVRPALNHEKREMIIALALAERNNTAAKNAVASIVDEKTAQAGRFILKALKDFPDDFKVIVFPPNAHIPLVNAINRGKVDLVREMLSEVDEPIQHDMFGEPILGHLLGWKLTTKNELFKPRFEILSLLLEKGFDPNVKFIVDKVTYTPLQYAKLKIKKPEVTNLLKQYGAV
jgi:hypothetical protein